MEAPGKPGWRLQSQTLVDSTVQPEAEAEDHG